MPSIVHRIKALCEEWRMTELWYIGAKVSLKEHTDFAIPWWRRIGIAYRAWRASTHVGGH